MSEINEPSKVTVTNALLNDQRVVDALAKSREAQANLEEARKLYESYELALDRAEEELRAAMHSTSIDVERDREYAEAILSGKYSSGHFNTDLITPDMSEVDYRMACAAILTQIANQFPVKQHIRQLVLPSPREVRKRFRELDLGQFQSRAS